MGLDEYRYKDPAKRRAYMKEWRRRRKSDRQAILNYMKMESGCVDCDIQDYRILDFDHVRGVKRYNIGSIVMMKWDTILEEIAKCEVRCRNCHHLITQQRKLATIGSG